MTLVCVPIAVESVDAALADARSALHAGADVVEFRVDGFFSGEEPGEVEAVVGLAGQSPLPCIMTCRPTWEGGAYDGTDQARIALFEALGTAERPPAYIDVELAAYTRSANLRQKVNLAVAHPKQERAVHTRLILSTHDFEGRPADLSRRLAAAYAEPAASVVKVAFRARSLRDNLELFEITRDAPRPTIALGMGEFGLMSRVLAPRFGGYLTFASLRDASATAPGQPTIADLLGLYRFRSIGRGTRLYGVVGWPVGHSLSPLIHNAGFEAVGWDGVYLPMPVAAGEDEEASYASFKATVGALIDDGSLGFAGASVTLPHKVNLRRLAGERGWAVHPEDILAGNTLSRAGEAWRVDDTDGPAVAGLLHEGLGRLAGARVCLVGTGGVARSIGSALLREGAEVVLAGRSAARAEALAQALEPAAEAGGGRVRVDPEAEGVEAFVHCTPVGMAGGPDPEGLGVGAERIRQARPGTVFLDTVYRPARTPMLRAAAERGCVTIDGVSMFVRQAMGQFRLWTGVEPPAGLFERVAREALGEA